MPLFVQVLRASEKMYLGVGFGSGVRTDYDMVHMRQPPRQCTHLAGNECDLSLLNELATNLCLASQRDLVIRMLQVAKITIIFIHTCAIAHVLLNS